MRAALILLLPVVALQVVVSVIFIQRHFEDVTTQMTGTVVQQLKLVRDLTQSAETPAAFRHKAAPMLSRLRIDVSFVPQDSFPQTDQRRWYDFSGREIITQLRTHLPRLKVVDLPDDRIAVLYVTTDLGPAKITVGRRRLSPAAPHQLPVAMLISGALLTVIAYIYLRNQLRPITKLALAAEAFGRGDVQPYHPSGAVEVRAAGSAFLDMRNRIERHIEQRTMMLSGVSHDLRTPLTRMKLGLAMLDDEDAAPLIKDVDEMQRLLDEFLNFASGAAEGEVEKLDPVDLVEDIVADAVRAGLPVTLIDIRGKGRLRLRRVPLRRAIENLISNAVRYGNKAELSVVISEKSLRIRIEDDGPGIRAEDRSEALKPFSRLDPARNQDKGGGVGLGLAIAADIARSHGGTLRLGRSDRLGGLQADIVIGR